MLPVRVVIPIAGAGVRLRPHTFIQPKPLIPIAGRPLLGHIMDGLIQAGFKDFVFVLGYLSEKVQHFVSSYYEAYTHIRFVYQEHRLGLAHAVSLTRPYFAEGEPMLIFLGDTLLEVDWEKVKTSPSSLVGVAPVERPTEFGVAEMDAENWVTRLVEKPSIPRSNQALVGLYLIQETKMLFEAIEYLIRKNLTSHGEYQLTDALQYLLERGVRIRGMPVSHWLNCEQRENLLAANRTLLQRSFVGFTAEYPYSVIIPPVYIPHDCKIYRAIIGPYVSLGEGAEIQNAVIQDSIIGAHSRVRNMILRNSVVGGDCLLVGREGSLDLGENTVIEL